MDYVDVFSVSVTEKENTLGTYIHGTNFPSPPLPTLSHDVP